LDLQGRNVRVLVAYFLETWAVPGGVFESAYMCSAHKASVVVVEPGLVEIGDGPELS
jgi:hypothetical protein